MPKKNNRGTRRCSRMRGGMLHLLDDAMRKKQLFYAILFSPDMQSSMPLGRQFEIILDNASKSSNCHVVRDGNIKYYSSKHSKHTPRVETVYDALDTYLSTNEKAGLKHLKDILVYGCNAELELKKSVQHLTEVFNMVQVNQRFAPSWLAKIISPLMVQPESAQERMKNFKCDAPDFASKVRHLVDAFTVKRNGKYVYTVHENMPVSGLIVQTYSDMIVQISRIRKSFEVKIQMLEMLRDLALPEMIKMYDKGHFHSILPEALFSHDKHEFDANVEKFRMELEEIILQEKYIIGLDIPSRMLRTISHVPNMSSASLRLAPPSAAIRDVRRSLKPFSVDPGDITRLKTQSALAKMLVERLSSHSSSSNRTRKSNSQKMIGWHHEEPKKDE